MRGLGGWSTSISLPITVGVSLSTATRLLSREDRPHTGRSKITHIHSAHLIQLYCICLTQIQAAPSSLLITMALQHFLLPSVVHFQYGPYSEVLGRGHCLHCKYCTAHTAALHHILIHYIHFYAQKTRSI